MLLSFDDKDHEDITFNVHARIKTYRRHILPERPGSIYNHVVVCHSCPNASAYALGRAINGCLNASAGVHRFSGLRLRHRSNRSTNSASSFASPSVIPLAFLPISLVLRSRVGFLKSRTFVTRRPVTLSSSVLWKLSISSKCWWVKVPFRRSLGGYLPRHSMIERNIWLLFRPVNKIFPVYSSKSVHPIDQTSIAWSYGIPRMISGAR